MAVFQLGPIIKSRREELGYSQEDLADGICSVPTLSRIENGERMPTRNHFEMLMQRLGYSAMSLDYYTNKQDFLVHEIKFKIRHAYIEKNYALAKDYLADLRKQLIEATPTDKQFVDLYQTLLYKPQYTNKDILDRLEKALLLTCPKYKYNRVPPVLSYEEIILLNNIAICYDTLGNREQAIFILYTLKNYYEHHVVSSEEALRTQPMILYNLSKFLGLSERYDECIEISNLGIRLAKNSYRCMFLAPTLFNRAWALLNRDQSGDKAAAKYSLKHAYYFSCIIGNQQDAEVISAYYSEKFEETISI